MIEPQDDRLAVVIGPAELAGPQDALLLEAEAPAAAGARAGLVVRLPALSAAPGWGHAPGCACCRPRGAVAGALGRLYLARARGEVAAFARVVAALADDTELRAALAEDRLVAGRYRLAAG